MEPRKVYIQRDDQWYEHTLDPDKFSIDESELDRELCNIGKHIFEYGTLAAEANLWVGKLDAELEKLGATLDAEVRAKFASTNEKATEAKVQNAVILDSKYQEFVQYKLQGEQTAALLKWAMVALQHKSEGLRALAYRENQSMKADRS